MYITLYVYHDMCAHQNYTLVYVYSQESIVEKRVSNSHILHQKINEPVKYRG